MVVSVHKCGQPYCLFPVEEGMQCDDCKKWFHKMCTRLSPAAYKRCSKPNSHWLCMFCCSSKTLLIQEAISLLALAKKADVGRAGNMDTDNEDCISVVNAAMAGTRHPISQQEATICTPVQPMKAMPLSTEGPVALAATEDPARTTIVQNSSNLDAENSGKWITRKRKRDGKTPKESARIVGKSSLDSRPEHQATPLKSIRKEIINTVVDGNSLTSPNVVGSNSLDPHDTVITKANSKKPVANRQDLTSRSKAVNTTFKAVKQMPSVIIWNLAESKDTDPAKRHAHDLQLVGSLIRNILPEEVPGVHISKVIRLGKYVGDETQQRRILKLVLGNFEERDVLLNNSRKTRDSNIRIRPDWPLEDRIKWKNALTELKTRRLNGEANLTIKGFRVVRSWKPMLPRPVWVERMSPKTP
ncbi:unnamed protein product [Schistosoma rodhaini]|uniref:PHD-type domain-containing protein n=1 Tax=Schistosoma rodhaini TaxID=6188 RepID=A0AA85G7X5_9TREM|nr:unnamed protein product [Schistosoma rodhaini]